MVLDVVETMVHFGSGGIESLFIGGFRGTSMPDVIGIISVVILVI